MDVRAGAEYACGMMAQRSFGTKFAIVLSYVTLIIVSSAIQIGLGADAFVVSTLAAASLLGAVALSSRNLTGADMLLVIVALYYGLVSLVSKDLLGQAAEQNLVAPAETTAALLISVFSIISGYIVSRTLLGRFQDVLKVGAFFSNPAALKAIATPTLAVGCLLYIGHLLLKADIRAGETEGFGGFGSFYFLVNIGLSMQYALAAHTGRKRHWLVILLAFGFLLFCSLLSNERRPLIDFCIVTVLSFIFIVSLRRKWWLALFGVVAGSFALLIISPAIQAVRLQAAGLSPLERVQLAWETMADAGFNPSALDAERDATAQRYQFTFGPNLSYSFPSTSDIDRYALIFPLDRVARTNIIDDQPLSSLTSGMRSMLPSFLVAKSAVSSGDEIAWRFGMRAYGSIGRPVLGAPASAFAIGRWWGVALLPGCLFFLVFSALQVIGGRLTNSPMAIALCAIIMVVVEYDVAGLLAYFVRPFWITLLTILVLRALTKRLPAYRKWGATRAASGNSLRSGISIPAHTRV